MEQEDIENHELQAARLEIEALKKELAKVNAFDVLRLRLALDKIEGASISQKTASGVIVEIRSLNSVGITGAFGIADGLGLATIEAIKADIKRTMDFRFNMSTPGDLRNNTNLMYRAEK